MLTKNEITALSLSPTKKDFVQIWNELLEVAGKLSERWDPTSTNESDPGIVILKALTGIADKLNYNIDKNTLEAFMPTAAQEDSMRKLCDMLGYNIKYYRSAETEVTIKYHNSDADDETSSNSDRVWAIPKFTVITNSDQDISYFTTNQFDYYISETTPSRTVPCMEGQIVQCESTTDNNIITMTQISENNRFYLPEAQIAENGIFVYNVATTGESRDSTVLCDGTPWEKVDNLNIQAQGSRVFKFGYDSYVSRPYIEFPVDFSELINDGLFIYYARTSGANGNVSPRTLTQLEMPSSWTDTPAESFSVENVFAATSGANIETISQAYNNFKKTIGTFETLVTCRDYMNKIYTMTDSLGKPFVSNILVSDIRTDLNRAVTICSCDDAGIFYKETPLTTVTSKVTDIEGEPEYIDGQRITTITRLVEKEVKQAIDHFDLVFYPFKAYSQIKGNVKDIQATYDASFQYNSDSFNKVTARLNELNIKTIAHNIITPRVNDVVSINNYLKLSATIGTNSKISTDESTVLIETIKIALANAFNMRELDFGEEIPFESIVEVIEKADPRIRVVSLNEPALYTTFTVFEGFDLANNAVLKEYAVASDWLTEAEADATGRFEIQKDAEGNYTGGTFNTTKAKEIYNKLAVRNILAGRVPLFRYNNTFNPSFSEGAYRTTNVISEYDLPDNMPTPSRLNPVTVFTDNNKTYVGQLTPLAEKPEALEEVPTAEKNPTSFIDVPAKVSYLGEYVNGQAVYSKIVYSETATPEEYPNNIIAKEANSDSNITEITTNCKVLSTVDKQNASRVISDVTLAAGEFIKFRAPNFITSRTYPAYVNYHLQLQNETASKASLAKASTLFTLLNGTDTKPTKWNELFETFPVTAKKTFTLYQKILPVSEDPEQPIQKEDIVIQIDNTQVTTQENSIEEIMFNSGCVKLVSPKAKLVYEDGTPLSNLNITLDMTPIITNVNMFKKDTLEGKNIPDTIDQRLLELHKTNTLPTDQTWAISFDFEYIPFDAGTLDTWANFIEDHGESLFGFKPQVENGTVLWRAYSGDSYAEGKYILESSRAKLMPFTGSYFGLLGALANRLRGIYIAEDLGADQIATTIKNDEEYKLRDREYLYIEYTPSTTTEDGTTQTQEPIKEVLGPGTIIRPGGFEGEGLIDSTVYAADHTPFKTITFPEHGSIPMHNLGANEQIEIRELAKVVLNKETFADSSNIYVYKNFINCPELETETIDEKGNRINNSYTLKDGEYIFYTDQNKAEFAYFTSGTEVVLTGKTKIPARSIIDLATIFESGIQEIPWVSIAFSNADSISFQEYQYITIGPDDTLKALTIVGAQDFLDSQWQYCDNIKYIPAGSETPEGLPKINLMDSPSQGSGWEACSILELNVSPSTAQTLRKTDKVETSIILHKKLANGVSNEDPIVLSAVDEKHPVSFKTNLVCQSSNGKVALDDLYTNVDNIKSFEVKIFTEETPSIIKTKLDSVIPYSTDDTVDITSWTLNKPLVTKNYNDLWSQVPLEDLVVEEADVGTYDSALKLMVSLLPNTYGVFSIYLKYDGTVATAKTWLELMPGTSNNAMTLLNVENPTWEDSKLILHPGLNCVRINTSCDVFIKTTSDASGTLYFDELRLVDTTPVEYIDEDGKKKYRLTQGLNLNQLGYLDTYETDFNIFNMRVRKKLKADYTEAALNTLAVREKALATEYNSSWNNILAAKPTIQALKAFLDTAKAEITAISEDPETLIDLIAKYNDIKEALTQEINLKNTLLKNKNIDDLVQELIDLLGNFASTEEAQQNLLALLGELRETAVKNSEDFVNLSKEDITDDFITAADSTKRPALVDELKFASLIEVNAQYNEQLKIIAEYLSAIADSESAARFTEALEKLHINKHAELVTQIQNIHNNNDTALSEAISLVHTASTGTLNADTNVIKVNYTEVAEALIVLREKAVNFDITLLISKIEAAVDVNMYSELAQLINDLKTLLTAENNLLIQAIDSLLVTVQSKTGTAQDPEIIKDITDIRDSILVNRASQITASLDKITALIDTALNDYNTAMSYLESATDDQVKALSAQLKAITDARTAYAKLVTDFNSLEYKKLPFGEAAVLAIWPKYMQQDLVSGVDKLYADIRAIINNLNPTKSLVLADSFNTTSGTVRPILETAANIAVFQELFEQANDLTFKNTQVSERTKFINDLGMIIPLPKELDVDTMSTEVKAIIDLDKNTFIKNIISELQDVKTITEKQQILKALVEELEIVIQLDTKLKDISANLICPSIMCFETKYANIFNSPICVTWKDFIISENTGVQAQLLASTDATISTTLSNILDTLTNGSAAIDTFLERLEATKIEAFKEYLASTDFTDLAETLLSNAAKTQLEAIQAILIKQGQLMDIKNCNLLKYLKDEDLTVAWYVTNKWVDSAGNTLTPTQDGGWLDKSGKTVVIDVRRDNNLKWYDCATDTEILIRDTNNTMWYSGVDLIEVQDIEAKAALETLLEQAQDLSSATTSEKTLKLEEELLAAIRKIDTNRTFYYNVSIEPNVAIDFNESDAKLNTLMNPSVNYDINNVNNSFVISKLDINYTTKGLQVARSSRIN